MPKVRRHASSPLQSIAALVIATGLSACTKPTVELSRAEPPWPRSGCVPPSEPELQILQSSASAITLDDQPISNFLTIGAEKLLGYGLTRDGQKGLQRVCTPKAILAQVGTAMVAPRGLGAGQLVEYQLDLAAQIPNPSSLVIEQVGNAAFNASPQYSEIFRRQDIRPLARSTLAMFGKRASAFSEEAVREMSSDSSLGTGAAQVAAATGNPAALPRIVAMFDDLLSSVPSQASIPLDKRDRLLELAWAIYFSGDAGRGAAPSIRRLMARKVESRAPPFGVVAIRPKRFCHVLELIEGPAALAPYEYCRDPSAPFEQ